MENLHDPRTSFLQIRFERGVVHPPDLHAWSRAFGLPRRETETGILELGGPADVADAPALLLATDRDDDRPGGSGLAAFRQDHAQLAGALRLVEAADLVALEERRQIIELRLGERAFLDTSEQIMITLGCVRVRPSPERGGVGQAIEVLGLEGVSGTRDGPFGAAKIRRLVVAPRTPRAPRNAHHARSAGATRLHHLVLHLRLHLLHLHLLLLLLGLHVHAHARHWHAHSATPPAGAAGATGPTRTARRHVGRGAARAGERHLIRHRRPPGAERAAPGRHGPASRPSPNRGRVRRRHRRRPARGPGPGAGAWAVASSAFASSALPSSAATLAAGAGVGATA